MKNQEQEIVEQLKKETQVTKKIKKQKKQKKNVIKSFFKALFWIILTLVIILVAWCIFSFANRQDSLSLIPSDFSVYIHTDSAWEALNPLLDLQAAEVLLSTPEFVQLRQPFMALRQSSLRENYFFRLLASRPVDVSLYIGSEESQDFVVVMDMGVFSAATRLAKFILPLISIEGLTFIQDSNSYHFEYKASDMVFYIKPYYNTVVVATSLPMLEKALAGNNDLNYSEQEKAVLEKKVNDPIKIVMDARSIVMSAVSEEPVLVKIAEMLKNESLALVSFGINDSQIDLNADIPLDFNPEMQEDEKLKGMISVLEQNSRMPLLLSRMSNIVQYYTLINAGSLEELKTAVFPLMPANVEIDSIWEKANSMCKAFFKISLEDIIFSWTGRECAAIGIEGLNSPVFVLQIKDEERRKDVFENVLSSIILKDDTSLILNGVRLPKISLPSFFHNLLRIFNVNIPSPYYMVHEGFIYFSESPEALSVIYTSSLGGNRISTNPNWKAVSEEQNMESTVSLFYDLERSRPFFLRADNALSKVLELYSIGRGDIRIKDSVLSLQLSVAARRTGQLRMISGFPMVLEGKSQQLQLEKAEKPQNIFWVENETTIKAMNFLSMQITKREMPSSIWITAVNKSKDAKGVIWVVNRDGAVFLLDNQLETVTGFPILLDSSPTAAPTAMSEGIVIPLADKTLCQVSVSGKVTVFPQVNLSGTVMSPATVLKNSLGKELIAFYDKSFMGKIYLLDEQERSPFSVYGIAFGSPALLETEDTSYTAFVTQAGRLSIWNNKPDLASYPREVNLNNMFHTNVITNGKYFFALSDDGTIYRITTDGEILSVKIPNATAKEATLTVCDSNHNEIFNIFVSVDGNLIYGFNENLELLNGFPLAGNGTPVFADVNGDGSTDCFVLTIDNKLNAWNLR